MNGTVGAGFKPAPTTGKTMKYDAKIHHRRSIRLKEYDYSQNGAYFVTVCTHNRECLLGEITDREMVLNEYGKIVDECWQGLPNHYQNMPLFEQFPARHI